MTVEADRERRQQRHTIDNNRRANQRHKREHKDTMNITIYTKPGCVQCGAAQRHMQKLGLDYEVVDLTQSPNDLTAIISLGYLEAPVTITTHNGQDTHWGGYQPNKIDGMVN